jgi:hypothetical protein
MRGAITPFPNTPSWCGTQLKKAQGQLYIYLAHTCMLCIFVELCSLVLNRYTVIISTITPYTLLDVYHDLPQSLHAYSVP